MRRSSWADHALALVGADEPAALITIADVAGSAPREAGAKMVVGAAETWGTIGGGNLEWTAVEQARRLSARADVAFLQQDYPLGPLLAQCCGGRVRLLIERLDASSLAWLEAAAKVEAAGERYTLTAEVKDVALHRRVQKGWRGEGLSLLAANGRAAGPKEPWARLVERIDPALPVVMLMGAGHVGRALADVLKLLPVDLRWFDSRPEMAGPRGLTAPADMLSAVAAAPPGAHVLVLTHSHELDYALVAAVLARGDAGSCGLIGSATKRARFTSRLAREGIDGAGLTCPIGAGAVGSKEPACIAVAAAAELMARIETSARRTRETIETTGV